MSYIREKAAYIKGLAEGLKLGEDTTEQKIIRELISLVDEMSGALSANGRRIEELNADIISVADDLQNLNDSLDWDNEEDVYSSDEVLDFVSPTVPPGYTRCPHCAEIFLPKGDLRNCDSVVQKCPSCGEKFILQIVR